MKADAIFGMTLWMLSIHDTTSRLKDLGETPFLFAELIRVESVLFWKALSLNIINLLLLKRLKFAQNKHEDKNLNNKKKKTFCCHFDIYHRSQIKSEPSILCPQFRILFSSVSTTTTTLDITTLFLLLTELIICNYSLGFVTIIDDINVCHLFFLFILFIHLLEIRALCLTLYVIVVCMFQERWPKSQLRNSQVEVKWTECWACVMDKR